MKIILGFRVGLWAMLAASLASFCAHAAGDRPEGFPASADGSTTGQYTGFTNAGSIANTRHNLSQKTLTDVNGGGAAMLGVRNDYGEVCVYCHTPHGANTGAAVPLWNRLLPTTTYTTYDELNTSTLTQTVWQPGAASLPCLSCHDGTQAIDAILNMPGSGGYNTDTSNTNLSKWRPDLTGMAGAKSFGHYKLNVGGTGCLSCHSPEVNGGSPTAVDFTVFVIGTDLRNDHPVGVNFPTVSGGSTDWKAPSGSVTRGAVVTKFFDENTPGRMDKGDIRLYGSGSDSRVECASCHDPHGVPSGGTGSTMLPTFLRKTNTGSAVCLTCHNK